MPYRTVQKPSSLSRSGRTPGRTIVPRCLILGELIAEAPCHSMPSPPALLMATRKERHCWLGVATTSGSTRMVTKYQESSSFFQPPGSIRKGLPPLTN
eukprot:670036-Prymnesium_polylepis.1